MLALIRKDLAWVLPLFVASVLTFFFVVISNNVGGTWISLDQPKWAALHLLFAFAAVLVGAALALRDPICGTRELLRHRSVSSRQLYRAQVLLGAIFVISLTAAWLAIDGTRLSIGGLWSIALVDLSPFAFVLSGSILALACFTVTLISLQLPVPWLGRVFALALLLLAVAVIHSLSTGGWVRDGYTASMSMHLLVMSALTLALLWLGARSTSLQRDPDRPLCGAGLRTVLWLVVPLSLPLVTLGVSTLQDRARDPLTSIRPIVVQTEEHGFTLARRQGRQGYTLLDADRRVLATGVPREALLSRSWPSQAWVSAPELFDYRLATNRRSTRVWQRDAWGQWSLVLSERSGELLATARSWAATPAPHATLQRRPDGAAFSAQAFFFEVPLEGANACFVVDPTDRSVWQLQFTPKQLVAPQLVRLTLPGSDPILGKGLARARGMDKWKTALLGKESGYIWDGIQWSIADQVDRRRHLPEPAFGCSGARNYGGSPRGRILSTAMDDVAPGHDGVGRSRPLHLPRAPSPPALRPLGSPSARSRPPAPLEPGPSPE
jgi:hypothetical protein